MASTVGSTVTGPSDLSFYWKVDSESGYDYLRFYIDGAEQAKISGSTSWDSWLTLAYGRASCQN